MSFISLPSGSITSLTRDIVSPMWDNNTAIELNALSSTEGMFISSNQTSSYSGYFYWNIYNVQGLSASNNLQFAIAYGNISGSNGYGYGENNGTGSIIATGSTNPFGYFYTASSTKGIYSEITNLVYADEPSQTPWGGDFTNNNGVAQNLIIFTINRYNYKESMQGGSSLIQLVTASAGGGYTTLTLTDDFLQNGGVTSYIGSNKYYTIYSASNSTVGQVTGSTVYGYMFPDLGTVVLNGDTIASYFGFSWYNTPYTASGTGTSLQLIYNLLSSKAASYNASSRWIQQNLETISSQIISANVGLNDLNYSTNPSFTDSNGNIIYSSLIYNPTVYPTTLGLYNNTGDLLAVAKLSQPLTKDFTKSSLIRVILDY